MGASSRGGGFSTSRTGREKVTVTLRPERVSYADRKARERGVSRSEVIDEMIAAAEEREMAALMVIGYKAMSQENLALAEEGMDSFWEVVKDDQAWRDAPDRPSAER